MKVLVVEDEPSMAQLFKVYLSHFGYDVTTVENGDLAWEILLQPHAPRLVVLDWVLPGTLNGGELCRRIRAQEGLSYVYLIVVTSRQEKEDVIAGLDAGADDFLSKPVDFPELASRMRVGERILQLETDLAGKIRELNHALAHVKQLQGLLPVCMHCKKIRDLENAWHQIESYIQNHSEAVFTHTLCRDCLLEHYPAQAKDMLDREGAEPG